MSNSFASSKTPELTEADLLYFCTVIKDRAGIFLKPAKHDLVRTRLRSRVIAHGFKSYKEYRDYLKSLPYNHPEWESFTNVLTTNKTDFFREPKHFDFLAGHIIPEWIKSGKTFFRIWSAACSTGEEPYTLAMLLDRMLPASCDFKILATDIDTEVLKAAENGVYHISKLPEIPPEYQANCVEIGNREVRGWFRIKPHLKEKVSFKKINLIDAERPSEDSFDLVLCRNVLIYFGKNEIEFVQEKLLQATRPCGHLFIGHSETFQGIDHKWKSIGPSIYKKAA